MIFYKADHEPNAGMVWGFKEAAPFMDYLNAFITLKKTNLQAAEIQLLLLQSIYILTSLLSEQLV